jgi:hypothetical protein
MINRSPQRKSFICFAFGGGFLLLGLLWMWSLQKDFSMQPWSVLNDPFLIALCVASAVAAGWFFRRYRGRGDRTPTIGNDLTIPIQSVSADPSALGKERESRSTDDHETLRWLIRVGCVASAVVLAGLVTGNLPAVIVTVALAEVVIAFVLIVVLVPRGL